jgi:hypothetical protein
MSWELDKRLAARAYEHVDERSAYRAGYADGFHGREMWCSNEKREFINAYSAGFHEGVGDSDEPDRKAPQTGVPK